MDAPVYVVIALLVTWLVLLTFWMAYRHGESGEPVYRRLPNGRIRFEWSVAQAYESAHREAVRRRTERLG